MVDVSTQQPLEARRLTVTIAPTPAASTSVATGASSRSPPSLAAAASATAAVFNRSPPPPPPTAATATTTTTPAMVMANNSAVSPTSSAATASLLTSARSVPSMSPVATGAKAAGRGLRQKMIDELKSVRRKSDRSTPALTPMAESAAGTLPPPLMLNAPAGGNSGSGSGGDESRTSLGEDAGGRLSSGQLSPNEQSGSAAKTKGCSICERSFTVFRAKHTCKVCGRRICDDCSKNRVKLNRRLERKKGSRLCDPCARKHVQASASPGASPALDAHRAMLQRRHSVPNAAFASAVAKAAEPRPEEQAAVAAADSAASAAAASTAAGVTRMAPGQSALTSGSSPTKYEPHTSHLRLRHWVSLAAISTLVAVRLLLNARSPAASASLLARSLDSVLSLRLLAGYVLALVAFDEVVRAKRARQVLAAPTRARRRRRTRSKAVGLAAAGSGVSLSSPATTGALREPEGDDEVLEVDTGDQVVATGFSLETLIAALEDAAVKSRVGDNELQLHAFLACCESICEFVLVFGRATSFAGSAVGAYISSIDTNLAAWPPAVPNGVSGSTWREQSVRVVVEREVELQVASVGGKKKPSCSRCVLRLLWFVEFVEACLKYTLIESVDESCSSGASKAYEETIGSRHPWIIRKGVNSALGSIPSRSAILADLHLSAAAPDDAIARLKVAQTHLRAVIAEIHHVLKKHELLDIK